MKNEGKLPIRLSVSLPRIGDMGHRGETSLSVDRWKNSIGRFAAITIGDFAKIGKTILAVMKQVTQNWGVV